MLRLQHPRRWAGALSLLLWICWQPATTQAQVINSDPGNYNCSRQYTLSLSPSHQPSCCVGSCLDSSPVISSSTADSCFSILELLHMHNGVVEEGDCLELAFLPGTYQLSSLLTTVRVEYSVVLSAPEGGVVLTCARSEEPLCECAPGDGGVLPPQGDTEKGRIVQPLVLFQPVSESHVFVRFEGIEFEYCSRQFDFISVHTLNISNCSFTKFLASALDLFNVQHFTVQQTSFTDCVSRNASAQFRAHGGAISVAYYQQQAPGINTTQPTLNINDCSFVNNSAFLPEVAEDNDQIDQAINTNIYEGRGGAMCIVPQDSYANVRGRISNTTFHHNTAELFGGATLIFITGNETSHEFVFEDCLFIQNAVKDFGGGIQVALLQRPLPDSPTKIVFVRSRFEDNSAGFGGGLGYVQVYSQGRGNVVLVEDSHFTNNRAVAVGSAIMFQTFAYSQSRSNIHFYNLTNCSFTNNVAPGGTLGAGFVNMNFFGTILFTNNSGPALRMVGGLTTVSGRLSFLANSATRNTGGALYIQEFGQVKLERGSQLEFINNTGRIGSAIVVDVQRSSPVFSELLYNPQCFLVHEDTNTPPADWTDVSILFSGNVASTGPVVFISHLLHCSWYSAEQVDNTTNELRIIFDVRNFTEWAVFHYEGNNKATSHSDEDPFDPNFYFQTQPVTFVSKMQLEKVRPGQTVPLRLSGIDQFGNPTYVIARMSDGRSNTNLGAFSQAVGNRDEGNFSSQQILRFEPALLPVEPDVEAVVFSYGFPSNVEFSELTEEDLEVPVVIDTPYNVIGSDSLTFSMSLANCQPGYQLRQQNNLYTCQCTDSDFYILNCEEEVIVLRDGQWAGAEMDVVPHLDLTVCPTPYCRCHTRGDQVLCESLYYQNSSEARQQCHPTRNGTLCGQCVNGTGVGVLRTNCRDCSDNSLYALGFLVIGDAIIIGFVMFCVMKLKLHFPHSLKGLLFYIQTVYYTTEHFPISFWDVRKYMLYLSSVVGLYFPYDFCLYPGMHALSSFGLKFIPPTIALIVGIIVTVGAYVMRSRNRKHVWKALWLLILLLYAPLLHTCVAFLKCPVIPGSFLKDEKRHWFYDGTVVCFQDPLHSVLSSIAIIVLIPLVLLSPALFIFTILAKTKLKKNQSRTMEWVVSALTEGYRDTMEGTWWASWELFRRLLLISIVVSLPGRSVAAAYVVIGTFAMHVFFKPYKNTYQNVIETLVLLNYIILLLLRSTQTFLDSATSLGYTGTAVPDIAGDGLPENDTLIWLFLPFYYFPLLFAVFFIVGALAYRSIKFIAGKRNKVVLEVPHTPDANNRFGESAYVSHRPHEVTSTEVYT